MGAFRNTCKDLIIYFSSAATGSCLHFTNESTKDVSNRQVELTCASWNEIYEAWLILPSIYTRCAVMLTIAVLAKGICILESKSSQNSEALKKKKILTLTVGFKMKSN